MLITPATLQALMTGFKKNFQDGLNTAESQWRDVATEIMSSNRQETYAWLGKTTAFREWVGDRVIQNLASHDYTIKNKSFENTIAVDRDEIEDDSLGIYRELFRQLGQDAAHHPDELVFGLLKDGFTKPCYDGQYFFDSDHPVLDENGDEISVSNMQSGASTPWFLLDTSKPLKPMIFQKRRDYDFVAIRDGFGQKPKQNRFFPPEFCFCFCRPIRNGLTPEGCKREKRKWEMVFLGYRISFNSVQFYIIICIFFWKVNIFF